MSLSQVLFGKDLYSLTKDDLESFFESPQEESSILEFKSGDKSIEGVSYPICAFLNTQGGILIYGAPKETTINGNRVCIGALDPNMRFKSIESFFQSLVGQIVPAPVGLRGQPIPCDKGYVFVVEVTQSPTPPHQCSSNGVYYIRLEREAKPAPHGLIEALFNRRQRPLLDCTIFSEWNGKSILSLHFEFQNDSQETAESIHYVVDIRDAKLVRHNDPKLSQDDGGVRYEADFGTKILPAGMKIKFLMQVHVEQRYALIDIHFWCRNSSVQRSITIFDSKHDKTIAMYNSRELHHQQTPASIQSIYSGLTAALRRPGQ